MPTKQQKPKARGYVSSPRFRQHSKSQALPLGQRKAKKPAPKRTAPPARKGVKRPGPVAVRATSADMRHVDFPLSGTYQDYKVLSDLPRLVYQSQELKRIVAAGKQAEADEKAIREEIEALLLAADLDTGTVTCGPYSVRRTEVRDREVLSVDKLRVVCAPEQIANAATAVDRERLLLNGVDADTIAGCIERMPNTGYSYATVRLTKGKSSASDQGTEQEAGYASA